MSKNQERYPDFKDWVWRGWTSNKVVEIDTFIAENEAKERRFHVGTDSKEYGKKTLFATALVAHHSSQGGSILIHKDKMNAHLTKGEGLRHRLIMEAMRTLEVAWYLDQKIVEHTKVRLHVDVNDVLDFKSGQYKEELVGMIMGQGYTSYQDIERQPNKEIDDFERVVFWKPDAWAAQSVADRRTK